MHGIQGAQVRGDGIGGFIAIGMFPANTVIEDASMAVGINQAGEDHFASGINDLSAGRDGHIFANFNNLFPLNQHDAFFQSAVGDCVDFAVYNCNHAKLLVIRYLSNAEYITKLEKCWLGRRQLIRFDGCIQPSLSAGFFQQCVEVVGLRRLAMISIAISTLITLAQSGKEAV